MKLKLNYCLLVLLAITFFSCDDDSDDKNLEVIEHTNKLYIENEISTRKDTIHLGGITSSYYKIKEHPVWMEFNKYEGEIENGILELDYNVKENESQSIGIISHSYLSVEIRNFGVVRINTLLINSGNPIIKITDDDLDFDLKLIEKNFTMVNEGDGTLIWKIEYKPDWIKISPTEGEITYYNFAHYTLSCDRKGLERGEYEDNIIISSNDKNNPRQIIKVRMKARGTSNPENIIPIEGTVKDSRYSKSNDKLYIITEKPNILLTYSGAENKWNEISLPKAPTCISLSEDEKQMFIGYDGLMNIVDLSNYSITKSINLDYKVYSIAYGENNFCYISYEYNYYYHNVDLISSSLTKSYSAGVQEYCNIYKIKNKPLLLTAGAKYYSNGVALIDISEGRGKDIQYWYEGLGSKSWFTEDYEYAVGAMGIIIKTPDKDAGYELPTVGQLGSDNYHYRFIWIDHNMNKKVFWTIHKDTEENNVVAYDDNNYKALISFTSEDYMTVVNGMEDFYSTFPYFVFSDKNGETLYVIRNIDEYSETNAWSLEIKQVNEIK